MQQVAHLHCWSLLRISECDDVLKIKTVWRQRPWSQRPGANYLPREALVWRLHTTPAAEAEGKKATACAHASATAFAGASGEQATGSVLQEVIAEWFVQGGSTKSSDQLQGLEGHLWYQCFARQRRNGNCFCRHSESRRNPSCLKTHLGERVRSEVGDSIFQGVWDDKTLPASECCHSLLGIWSADSRIYNGVAGKDLGAVNGGATHWQRRHPFSLQECGSCCAVLALGASCTSRHQTAQLLPPSLLFLGD